MTILITGPAAVEAAAYENVIRSLPRWFGVEEALMGYVHDTASLPTFNLFDSSELIGFVSLRQHFAKAWEINCIAVSRDVRGKGHGRALMQRAEHWLAEQGVTCVQVKTLADSHPSPEYRQTRAFYEHMGYQPVEVFPDLWVSQHPALLMMKFLAPG